MVPDQVEQLEATNSNLTSMLERERSDRTKHEQKMADEAKALTTNFQEKLKASKEDLRVSKNETVDAQREAGREKKGGEKLTAQLGSVKEDLARLQAEKKAMEKKLERANRQIEKLQDEATKSIAEIKKQAEKEQEVAGNEKRQSQSPSGVHCQMGLVAKCLGL
ncbi:hypothetical protein HDV00_002904 [Rhizophlyctis rosea]|nr:hypothetical protein HDV00_002904 [Rhizophlyctis rosea]